MEIRRQRKCFIILIAVAITAYFFSPYVFAEDFFVAKVQKVLEGDKILLQGGTVVQYMGINAPRTRVSNQIFQDIALAALQLNKKLVEGKTVRLEIVMPSSISTEDSRKFAYVFIGGRMVNALLVKKGLAVVSDTYPPAQKYQSFFSRAQQQAVLSKAGIWQKIQTQKQNGSVSDYAFQ